MSLIVKTEDEYQDLLGQWSDLESGLAVVLTHPDSVQEFEQRIHQYDRWMRDLLKHDTDIGLYLLFQLAIHSPVGYSASHALVCAVLCHLLATDLALPQAQRNSLVRAALTMNLAMTRLQDQLANQRGRPSHEQQIAIRDHADQSALMLTNKGIANRLWLETVQHHHQEYAPNVRLNALTPAELLAHILQVVDRYAAMISPRQSRAGRSASESAQSIVQHQTEQSTAVGQSLVRIVGLCPPGTFVQLEGSEIAVVTRRSSQPNLPDIAMVIDQNGKLLRHPTLHHTTLGKHSIHAALVASAVQERISHHLILQLGTQV
jgi:HD-GYP domain-containing protein (c-di-GMP phosphodiesterase class II)